MIWFDEKMCLVCVYEIKCIYVPTFQNLISECGSMVARLPRDWHRWPNGDQLESWKVNWKLKVVIFVQLLNLEACGLPMLTEKPLQYFEQTRGITWYPWYVCVCILTVCLIVSNLSVSQRGQFPRKNFKKRWVKLLRQTMWPKNYKS